MKKIILAHVCQFTGLLFMLGFSLPIYAYEYCAENLSGQGCEVKATIKDGGIQANSQVTQGVVAQVNTYAHTRACISNPVNQPISGSTRKVQFIFEATNSNCYFKKFTCEQRLPNDGKVRVIRAKFGYNHGVNCLFAVDKSVSFLERAQR